MTTYVIFGETHTHLIDGKTFDKDCVAVINRNNEQLERDLAMELFGGLFFTTYNKPPKGDSMQFFPRGLIEIDN